MKVKIEKKIESLQDLQLAKEALRKKAKRQEHQLITRTEMLYTQLSPKRIYDETLDSFDLNGLLMQLLPYALKYKDELTSNPIVTQLSKIKKKHIPYYAGAAALLGAMAYYHFSQNDEAE